VARDRKARQRRKKDESRKGDIYTAAFDNTKRGQFEIFWYSHHVFILFFVFLFVHGKKGLNPGYWPYIIAPGALYFLERLLRIYRANQRVVVLSATIMDDVFSLEFAKEGVFASPYKEGQYIFLNSPPISLVQWHPFTISSAPEEKTVTVHIRVSVDGSWTKELCAYVSAMGPKGKPYFGLDRQGPQGKLAGKVLGPDGKQMLCIDGPHSAPTQHVSEYSTALIIGAGIGATPVSATLKSVVFHRWKYREVE
jgi:NAD(P)H-flavin reductase